NQIPVLVLSRGDSVAERVSCLNERADDVLCKPFALIELEARLRAIIRRSHRHHYARITCGPLQYDALSGVFLLGEQALSLSRREHALLFALIQRAGKTMDKQALFDRIFAQSDDVNLAVIELLVFRLRKKLTDTSVRIVNVRG